MKVRATVDIKGCDFDAWKEFYDSYAAERAKYVIDEVVTKSNDHWAEVVFEITDVDGLTKLSSRQDIRDFEILNQITVSIEPT